MARQKILSDLQKLIIALIKLEARKQGRDLTYRDVINEMRTGPKPEHSGILAMLSPEADLAQETVSPTATRKFLSELNKKIADEELEQPWHLGLMREPGCAVRPQAVPRVVAMQSYMQRKGEYVSIRQARWIEYLSGFDMNQEDLYYNTLFYSLYEQICSLAGIPFITTGPDKALPDSEKVKEAFIELLLKED